MSTQIQWRKGTTAQHAGFTGAQAEVTVDTDKNTVVVHDGITAGGIPLAKFSELGVGKTSATGSAILPKGTTAERDAVPLSGYTRFNTTTGLWEGYNGAIWTSLGDLTNIAGGSANSIPYQSSANNTAMLAAGTAGQVLETGGAITAPVWAYRHQQENIDYTLASNNLTLKLNPTTLEFRSTTLTVGTPVKISNAAQITTFISSGSTGGTISGVQSDLIILAINNAGTMELAWTNAAGGLSLDETGLITTITEGSAGTADSATVIYSDIGRVGVAYRVVGIFRSTQTVAGTWAQAPILVQGVGGQTYTVRDAVIDVTSTSTDTLLLPGQIAYRTYALATSIPLRIATVSPGEYEITMTNTTASAAFVNNAYLNPNNTTYAAAIPVVQIQANATSGVVVASAATDSQFRLSTGGTPLISEGKFVTTTTSKSSVCSSRDSDGTSGFISTLSSRWTDTTTAWTSLGTIVCANSLTGEVTIRRIR